MNLLEKYVCYLYRVKSHSINDARWKIFDKKYQGESKESDLAYLPPSDQVFLPHALRYKYVAYMWRESVQRIVALPDRTDNGWLATGETNELARLFQRKSSLFYVMTATKKISKNSKRVPYLNRSFIMKLIAMMMSMTFYFDETLKLCS